MLIIYVVLGTSFALMVFVTVSQFELNKKCEELTHENDINSYEISKLDTKVNYLNFKLDNNVSELVKKRAIVRITPYFTLFPNYTTDGTVHLKSPTKGKIKSISEKGIFIETAKHEMLTVDLDSIESIEEVSDVIRSNFINEYNIKE